MKTFLEFLFRSGKLPAASLARAQVEQLRRMPSFAEVAANAGLLAPESLLEVLLAQEAQGVSFVAACRARGLWSADLEAQLLAQVNAARVPLVDLLAADPCVPAPLLRSLVEEFRALPPVSAPAPPTGLSPRPVEVRPAAPLPEPAPPAGEADAPNLDHADPLMAEALRKAWDGCLTLRAGPAEPAECHEIMHAFHGLKGALRFNGPAAAERWADFGEQIFRLAAEVPGIPSEDLREIGRDALRIVAAEGGSASVPNLRKEALIDFLKKLRKQHDTFRSIRGESA